MNDTMTAEVLGLRLIELRDAYHAALAEETAANAAEVAAKDRAQRAWEAKSEAWSALAAFVNE